VAALARSLAGAYQQLGVSRDWADIKTAISNGNGALRGVVEDLVGRANDRSRVLLVVDQAEELLTQSGGEERRVFLALVRDCLHADVPVWVVQTARSEFLSTTPERSGLAEALDDSRVVEPLSPDRLPEVIEGPAALVDLRFAPGLVQRMVGTPTRGTACPFWRTRCVSSINGWEPVGRCASMTMKRSGASSVHCSAERIGSWQNWGGAITATWFCRR
jgi:Novel STAND NTPase 1